MQPDTKTLIAKLNFPCKKSLESASALCVSKTHFNVELEHFLLRLLEMQDTDIQLILRRQEQDIGNIIKQLNATVEKFPTGNRAQTVLSPHISTALQEAWMVTSLKLDEQQIRSGAVLLAILETESLRGLFLESCPLLLRISGERYREHMRELLADSPEAKARQSSLSSAILPLAPVPSTATSALNRFTTNLTAQARAGKLDPIYGRDTEIRQLIDVLSRRRQNNPILVGEAGVGKTAVVEGLAQRIVTGDIPPSLKNIALHSLDVGLLQAGAGMKGEFEERLKTLLEEVKTSPVPVVLFIDEAHTLMGAGGTAGVGDAANLLKPALARGELRTIAATTWAEYKRYIEKDAALTRRFEVVKIDEPSPEKALDMIRSMAGSLAKYHHVTILDEGMQASVSLTQRFLTGRQLPDKAVSVLDTACAQVALSGSAVPEPLEQAQNRIILLNIEKEMLLREQSAVSHQHAPRLAQISREITTLTCTVDLLEKEWKVSLEAIVGLKKIRERLNEFCINDLDKPEAQELQTRIQELEKELNDQSYHHLVLQDVNREAIARVIAGWTGIPVETMTRFEEGLTVDQLMTSLQKRIVGQGNALNQIARQVISYRAGLSDPHKPMGVFLLAGPSGVGKTETAQVLAEVLNGHERHLIRINMSEFQESHAVATLKGAPPGYVGYGKGGTLTEAVRKNPYSVVLLDEVEKAHKDVMEIFYQVFDKGMIEDSEGIEVDFRNTLIILTSNIGADVFDTLPKQSKQEENRNSLSVDSTVTSQIHKQLEKHFPHAFLARLSVISYFPLTQEELCKITHLKLGVIADRILKTHNITLVYKTEDEAAIVAQCTDFHQGARAIDHILTQQILPALSEHVLKKRNENIHELRLRDVL